MFHMNLKSQRIVYIVFILNSIAIQILHYTSLLWGISDQCENSYSHIYNPNEIYEIFSLNKISFFKIIDDTQLFVDNSRL